MVNMTLAIPDNLSEVMKKHTEIKWSEVARKAIAEKAKVLELMDAIMKKSTLTEKDAMEIGAKIKKGIAKRHGLVEDEYTSFLEKAKNKITDQKDVPYLALALAIEADGILTQDKDFQKQKEIKIYALHDLFALL